jgi:hypothetical protein
MISSKGMPRTCSAYRLIAVVLVMRARGDEAVPATADESA